jgi:hypothetical protein
LVVPAHGESVGNRHEVLNMHRQVEIVLADPVFDPTLQMAR